MSLNSQRRQGLRDLIPPFAFFLLYKTNWLNRRFWRWFDGTVSLKSWGNTVVREKVHNMRLYANDFHKRHFLLPLTTITSLINVANYVCFAYVYTRKTIIKGNKSPIMFLWKTSLDIFCKSPLILFKYTCTIRIIGHLFKTVSSF